MPPERPIACSLSGAELSQRLAEMSSIGRAHLLGVRTHGARSVLRFRAGARHRLAAVVAAEAECCPFLRMNLADKSGPMELTIDAPVGAEAVVQDIVNAFKSEQAGC